MRSPRRSARATALVFALSGFLIAGWLARLPATRDRLHADPASLGLALLMTGLGSLVLMPFTGRMCARWGSATVVAAAAVPCCVVLQVLTRVPNVAALGAGLFVLGAGFGTWDVAMNIQGSAIDRLAGRDFMPRYHACWSIGAILGAGTGSLAARAGIGPGAHFLGVALVVLVGLAVGLPAFLPDRGAGHPLEPGSGRSRAALLTPALLVLGVVTLCATCIEGAAGDWIALYLADDRGASQSVAAAGFAVFSVAMAGSRLLGTWLIAAVGRTAAVRLGGVVTGVGIVGTVTLPGLPGALLGALGWGLGVAVVFPAAMSAGGQTPGRAADAIAAVSTIGYGGFLVGPPLIGLLAKHVGLGHALLALVVMAVGIAVLAPAVAPRQQVPAAG